LGAHAGDLGENSQRGDSLIPQLIQVVVQHFAITTFVPITPSNNPKYKIRVTYAIVEVGTPCFDIVLRHSGQVLRKKCASAKVATDCGDPKLSRLDSILQGLDRLGQAITFLQVPSIFTCKPHSGTRKNTQDMNTFTIDHMLRHTFELPNI